MIDANQLSKLKDAFSVHERMPVMADFVNPNWTSEIFKHIVSWIQDFDARLDPEHELGVKLVTFGQAVQFYLESMEYCSSPLLLFKGMTPDGDPVELIQHVSQISILLTKLPKQDPNAPKRKIGFHTENESKP